MVKRTIAAIICVILCVCTLAAPVQALVKSYACLAEKLLACDTVNDPMVPLKWSLNAHDTDSYD
ncbi:MAG: hypothetical protein FJY85_06650, partial [Deltaproteobacteria bacterium]|nr:hypothetical protein [Deltaproteobacteria bacterium]